MLKKLRDVTPKEFNQWLKENCIEKDLDCKECVFREINCCKSDPFVWVNNKKSYSKTVLSKKIEVSKINILTKKEKKYLSFVIKPFRDEIIFIRKSADDYDDIKFEWLTFVLQDGLFSLPSFKPNTMYKNMEIRKKYTLEELGL